MLTTSYTGHNAHASNLNSKCMTMSQSNRAATIASESPCRAKSTAVSPLCMQTASIGRKETLSCAIGRHKQAAHPITNSDVTVKLLELFHSVKLSLSCGTV